MLHPLLGHQAHTQVKQQQIDLTGHPGTRPTGGSDDDTGLEMAGFTEGAPFSVGMNQHSSTSRCKHMNMSNEKQDAVAK